MWKSANTILPFSCCPFVFFDLRGQDWKDSIWLENFNLAWNFKPDSEFTPPTPQKNFNLWAFRVPCAKNAELCLDTFWHFLTFFLRAGPSTIAVHWANFKVSFECLWASPFQWLTSSHGGSLSNQRLLLVLGLRRAQGSCARDAGSRSQSGVHEAEAQRPHRW